jgi:hypothetical protein
MSSGSGLPDLLRRLVATPYGFRAIYRSTVISFETNNRALLAIFRARAEELAGALTSDPDKPWRWKIVGDTDTFQGNPDPLLFSDDTTSTLFLGTGTVVGIDWHRGELLGFIAADTSAQCLLDLLVDAARQHIGRGRGHSAGLGRDSSHSSHHP